MNRTARTAARTTARTAAATAVLAGVAALGLAAPALADVIRSAGEVTRYDHTVLTPPATPKVDVPAGGTARVQSVETGDGKTIVTLDVTGFRPLGRYGAHAHNAPCGDPALDPKGLAAKGHFQYVVDPVQPSVDEAYANPRNEIWLDLTTDTAGDGHARSKVDWQFPSDRRPKSVIIHERHTTLGGTTAAGTAGLRVACLNVSF